MKRDCSRVAVTIVALAGLAACGSETATTSPDADAPRPIVTGGDGRAGAYEAVDGWWKPAPDHDDRWTWGEVSGVAVDTPDRIIVAVWGDRSADGEERDGSSNYLVVVDRHGNVVENWSQWDATLPIRSISAPTIRSATSGSSSAAVRWAFRRPLPPPSARCGRGGQRLGRQLERRLGKQVRAEA